jgi:hypothetical protein
MINLFLAVTIPAMLASLVKSGTSVIELFVA